MKAAFLFWKAAFRNIAKPFKKSFRGVKKNAEGGYEGQSTIKRR